MGLDTNARQALTALRSDGALEAAPETEFDLRRMMLVVWRAKWLMALFAVLGVTIAYAHLLRVTSLYTAESRVLWEINQANVVDLDPVARGLERDFFSLNSQIEVIKSGRLLGRVVTDLERPRIRFSTPACGRRRVGRDGCLLQISLPKPEHIYST